jgi:hypothetical protein
MKPWLRRLCVNSLLQALRTFVRPTLNTNNHEFELKPSLINMVQATTFNGKAQEAASTHLQNFLEIYSTVVIKHIAQDIILLHLFPFSLEERAKQWFYTNKD